MISENQLAARRSRLSPAMLALLAQRLGSKVEESEKQQTIPRRSGEGPVRLSFAQQRLWFLNLLEPGSTAYNMPTGLRLLGNLDGAALEPSFTEVVGRHEVLRTRIESVDGTPVQVVMPAEAVDLSLVDLRAIADEERAAFVRRMAVEEGQRVFDLSQGRLLRHTLLRLGAEEHVLLLTMHHIVSDGWSMEILTREVSTLYAAYASGQESPLAELPIQYADYAVWQREWLQGEVLEEQLGYWRKQLADAPAVLDLPTDRNRPAQQSAREASLPLQLSTELTAGLKQLSKREGVTLFMTLLAAWQLLLARYSRQPDVVVGSPVANRTRAEVEGLIGFFVNTLVLRTEVSSELRVRELLQRVREVCLGAYAHQEVPFEMLVEQLQPERDLSYTPLFQVMLVLQNAPQQGIEWAGVQMRALELESGTAKYDLTLGLAESERGLVGTLEYNRDLYERESMERLVAHYQQVLSGLVEKVEQRVSDVRLLSEAEEAQVLRQENERRAEYEVASSLTELFERQVERAPEATALLWEEQQVSYAELNRRANQLAHYLRRLGVGPESLVALVMERSVEMGVAVLGVLKAGGAYLPVDPAYPGERVRFMLEDAGASVVLASGVEFKDGNARVVRLDQEWQGIAAEPEANLESVTVADNLAYVIYTSGSTGRPKGMMITHRNVLRLFATSEQHFHFNANDVWSLFHSYAFDFSVWELWGALLYGGKLLLVKYWESRSPSAFLEQVREAGVTVLNQTPSAFRQLQHAEAEEPSGRLKLRVVIFGGEALELSSLKPWVERHGAEAPQLVNMYGITETTVHVTYRRLRASEIEGASGKVIGQALDDLVLYVLDERMQVLPVGVAGEMYVGGAGLGRGYLGRPELTATRFVPDPYSGVAGARLYRTGDVGRYRASGELEYVGRADEQVKVRGHRIELGEIEAALQQHEGVREAVVLVRGEAEQQQLVGYVVVAAGETVTSSELRASLEQRLPEYMIPQAFVALEQWPLTVNGKLDRNALPEPDGSRPELGKEYVAPRTAVEEVLAGVWSEVLGIEQISIHDNFFELGGHSLLATQVVSRVREAFRVDLPLSDVFERATVTATAGVIEARMRGGSEFVEQPIRVVPRSEVLPLSFAQQRLWFLDQMEPGTATYNIPVGIRLSGSLEVAALERSISEVVRRHETLRTRFVEEEGRARQVIEAAEPVRLPVTELGEQEAIRLANEEARRPFDLACGPLWRGQLIRLSAAEHVLLFTMHHIVSDGWSMNVLTREVSALYEAYVNGGAAALAELPIQYADYAVWQREWLQGEVLEEQLGYWRKQLAGAPAVLELPADHQRPVQQSHRGANLPFQLSQDVSRGLKQLSQREGVTLFMTLLAAWQLLLARYSRQSDVVVGSPVANRTRAEVEGLIGFFVNTLVLRTEVSSELRVRELLQRVREVCLGAYAHQEVPFEMLVEQLQPERDLSYTPLFQVMLVLQNAPQQGIEWAGVQMRALELESGTAKYDLTLGLAESERGLVGTLEYNRDLYERASMERLVGHYQQVLSGLVEKVEQRGSDGRLRGAREEAQVLRQGNERRAEYEVASSLTELFERQVERAPEATALLWEEQQVSNAELNARANQLGHYLRRLGVGPESLVALVIERSVEMVVAVLGVLKAGGAYLPVDPAYPGERVRFMLKMPARQWC